MSDAIKVLNMLLPDGGWVLEGDSYEGIKFIECEPITKKQFEDGFKQYDAWKIEQDAELEAKKIAAESKLGALGLTVEDLKVLGLG